VSTHCLALNISSERLTDLQVAFSLWTIVWKLTTKWK